MSKRPNKIGYGLACFRYSRKSDSLQVLMIKKRNTFAYVAFVNGKYRMENRRLLALFNSMTNEEKLEIASLDFAKIWYRVWLSIEPDTRYLECKQKFERNFIRDNGAELRRLLSSSHSIESIWELPKGRINPGEKPLNCAIREFQEETGISPSSYTLLDVESYTNSIQSDRVNYISHYYIVLIRDKKLNNPANLRLNYQTTGQTSEVIGMKWMDLPQIRILDTASRIYPFLKIIFRKVQKDFKVRRIENTTYNGREPRVLSKGNRSYQGKQEKA